MKLTYFSLWTCILFFASTQIHAQSKTYFEDVEAFQEEYEAHYTNPETSPFKKKTHLFQGHSFFPIDSTYRVQAVFTPEKSDLFLATSTSRYAEYTKLGTLTFELHGERFSLTILYNEGFSSSEEYVNKAFVPFMDLTNGESTYTNGRYCYVDLPKEEGDIVTLDFNKSTNPYCAYVSGYSCAVPPDENNLSIEILAGVQDPK